MSVNSELGVHSAEGEGQEGEGIAKDIHILSTPTHHRDDREGRTDLEVLPAHHQGNYPVFQFIQPLNVAKI